MPSSAADFARFARELGTEPSTVQTYLAISDLDPLPAVIQCAKDATAITQARATQLSGVVSRDSFANLVGPKDPLVLSPEDMQKVPEGAFIAFIYLDPPTATTRPFRRAKRHLVHVMVSLGNGWAAGTKGANIGLPVTTTNWQPVNLTTGLNWHTFRDTYDAIAESLGLGSPRHFRIRYRKIENFQEADTVGAAPAVWQGLVPQGDLQNYFEGEGWWHYRRQKGIPDEGWKLHVSCSETNAAQILNLVLPKLREGNFAHKFILMPDEVEAQNADPVQRGKIVAIYPDNILEAFNIVGVVDAALNGHANRAASPVIADEIRVGNTVVVYARYGPFASKFIFNQAGTGYEPDPKGVAACPDWIQNPWDNYPNQTGLNNFPAWPKHILRYPGEKQLFFAKRVARQSL